MSKFKILVVDDEKLVRWSLEQALTMEGYTVSTAETGEEAIHKIKEESPDLILLDVKLPAGIDGIAVLANLREFNKEAIVIMLTAHDTAEAAVRALKLGAYEYICKPFNLDELKIIIKNAFETINLRRQVAIIRSRQESEFGFDNIIGKSQAMHEVFTMIKKVSETDTTTILLLGESGTGKDLAARTIHYSGSRKDSPFLEINCAALPEHLLESELLGYEKGAFTDAKSQKKGMFELADGGSIFLDEIGDMKLSMQVKLLRVIEDKKFKRLGGTSDVEVDVRIISASNRDLAKAVKEEKFREDLYYRLNIVPITIPPLRERKEDIPLLIKFFIDKFNSEFKKNVKGISKKAEELLLNYAWPGNVRELKNVIERAMILENVGIISDDHLPLEIKGYEPIPLKETKGLFKIPSHGVDMEEVEKELVRQALDMAGGNQTRAAKLLNIKRDALRYKMQKFGLLSFLIIWLGFTSLLIADEANPAKFLFSIEREASEALEKPKEIFIDNEHKEIYVSDNKGKPRIQVFNQEGAFLYDLNIGTKFSLISGIAVSKSGRIYISVPAAKEVTILDFRGKLINKLDFSDIPEAKERLPGKLTLDSYGNLYCIDHKNQQVLVFDERDGFKFKFGSKGNDDGKFQNISDITVSHSNIFVLDAMLGRISVFDKDGRFLSKFGQKGSGVGKMSQPAGIAVDKGGNIFITDSFRHNVLVFNKDYNLWFEFGGLGTGTGWFINPSEIAIDETGRIYVVDWGNGRIQVFEIEK